MAFDAEISRTELRNVIAPSGLFDPINETLDSLNLNVLHESARLAKARTGSKSFSIERGDVLNAVRTVLADAASDIEKALGNDESKSVRRAS